MSTVYQSAYVSLHVRKTNRAAISLYRDSLGFEVHDVEISYCESRSFFPSLFLCRGLGAVDATRRASLALDGASLESRRREGCAGEVRWVRWRSLGGKGSRTRRRKSKVKTKDTRR